MFLLFVAYIYSNKTNTKIVSIINDNLDRY